MKILLSTLSLFVSTAFASTAFDTSDSIKGYYVGTCNSWTMVRSDTGVYAWGCSVMPSTVVVPDAYDVADEIADLKARVAKLEKKLEALSSAP